MTEKTTALAIVNEVNLPALNGEMKAAIAEEMDGLQVNFTRVKIPSGGGLAFEVPGDDPDNPEAVKELTGIIVDHYPVNAYWQDKFTGQNNPPDCSSMDGKFGVGNPGGPCEKCPFNQWGSAENNGKACKNMHRVYLLQDGEPFPLLLTLPPTSIKNISDYLAKRVLGKGKRSYEVLTKVSLKKATSSGGISYSQAVFALAGVLSPEITEKVTAYAKGLKSVTRNLEIAADEYNVGTNEDSEDAPF